MNSFIYLIGFVPDTIWAAIIASCLTFGGVLITNRNNNKRFISQLNHEASQRDRDREMGLRREVYLVATEWLYAIHSVLVKLQNLNISDAEINSILSDAHMAIGKVNIIGSDETVQRISDFIMAVNIAYTELYPTRIKLLDRRKQIANYKISIDKCSVELDKILSISKEPNLQSSISKQYWETLEKIFEKEKNKLSIYEDKKIELEKLQKLEWSEFIKESYRNSNEVGRLLIPAINAIRKELEIPYNVAEYERVLLEANKKMESAINKLLQELI